jgi:predicted nucleic acid-binding protein
MYAVGREHPLRPDARRFFEESLTATTRLCTSAEVLQELSRSLGSRPSTPLSRSSPRACTTCGLSSPTTSPTPVP